MAGGHAWWGGVAGGVHGRGACVVGAMHRGACMVVGTCMAGGACMVGGMHGRYYEIWSMSRQYASYWNAFLF